MNKQGVEVYLPFVPEGDTAIPAGRDNTMN